MGLKHQCTGVRAQQEGIALHSGNILFFLPLKRLGSGPVGMCRPHRIHQQGPERRLSSFPKASTISLLRRFPGFAGLFLNGFQFLWALGNFRNET